MNNIEKHFIENMGKMEYNDFLMSQLLTVYIPEFGRLPYDILFDVSLEISKEFTNSKYDNAKIPLYEAIVDFIKEKRTELIKKIEKDI